MKKNDVQKYTGTIQELESKDFGSYLAVLVTKEVLGGFLKHLKCLLGDTLFERYTSNQIKRDEGKFHLTVIDPIEMLTLKTQDFKKLVGEQVTINLIGLGSARKKTATYFVVVESDCAQQSRNNIGLDNKDLHITLGFDTEDLYDIPKDRSTLVLD